MSSIGSPFRAEMRATLALAVPLAGANLVSMAMGLTNAIMVGRLGGSSLAAAGLGAGIYFTTVLVCQGVLLAVAPLAAHALGADDHPTAARTSGAGLLLAAALAIPVLALLSVAHLLFARLGYDSALATDIARFLSAIRWGAPAFLAFAVLRAMSSASSRVRPVMMVRLLDRDRAVADDVRARRLYGVCAGTHAAATGAAARRGVQPHSARRIADQ